MRNSIWDELADGKEVKNDDMASYYEGPHFKMYESQSLHSSLLSNMAHSFSKLITITVCCTSGFLNYQL